MTVVMAMNGLLSIADAVFLGRFVGADAMAAVSLAFPVIMLAIALSTLVSGGMSSLLARHLGAGGRTEAEALFARTHGLSLCVSLALIAAFFTVGPRLVAVTAAEAPPAPPSSSCSPCMPTPGATRGGPGWWRRFRSSSRSPTSR